MSSNPLVFDWRDGKASLDDFYRYMTTTTFIDAIMRAPRICAYFSLLTLNLVLATYVLSYVDMSKKCIYDTYLVELSSLLIMGIAIEFYLFTAIIILRRRCINYASLILFSKIL